EVGAVTVAHDRIDRPKGGFVVVVGVVAVPVKGITSGELAPECVTESLADRAPVAVGRKTTGTVTDSPGPRVTGVASSNWSANIFASGPAMAGDDTVREPPLPTFVRATYRV